MIHFLQAEIPTVVEAEVAEALSDVAQAAKDLPDSLDEVGGYLSNLYSVLAEYAVSYGGRILAAILITVIGFRLVSLTSKRFRNSKAFQRFDTTAKNFFFKTLVVIEKVLIVILAASVLGVPMASVVTVIGSCGLAIGLALQGSLGNIAGGFVLMATKPFTQGDFIIVGSDEGGTVEELGVFYTSIITMDNRRIVYPNSAISAATIINVTAEKKRRVDLTFNVGYSADIALVRKVMTETALHNEKVLQEPAPFARLSKHGDSALEFTLRVWCGTEDYWQVYFDMLEEIKTAFDKNGIPIPYTQMDVHLDRPDDNKNL